MSRKIRFQSMEWVLGQVATEFSAKVSKHTDTEMTVRGRCGRYDFTVGVIMNGVISMLQCGAVGNRTIFSPEKLGDITDRELADMLINIVRFGCEYYN